MQFNLDTLFYYIIECVVQKLDMQCTFINGIRICTNKNVYSFKIQGKLYIKSAVKY